MQENTFSILGISVDVSFEIDCVLFYVVVDSVFIIPFPPSSFGDDDSMSPFCWSAASSSSLLPLAVLLHFQLDASSSPFNSFVFLDEKKGKIKKVINKVNEAAKYQRLINKKLMTTVKREGLVLIQFTIILRLLLMKLERRSGTLSSYG